MKCDFQRRRYTQTNWYFLAFIVWSVSSYMLLSSSDASSDTFTIVRSPPTYPACCKVEGCMDQGPEFPGEVGCDPEQCSSSEGETCRSDELTANCHTFNDNTFCTVEITYSYKLTRKPPPRRAADAGCCDSCVAFPPSKGTDPDWQCQNCSSATSVNDCAADQWKANCTLIGGTFSCTPADTAPPCPSPPCRLGVGGIRTR